jgi:hypothetical protein
MQPNVELFLEDLPLSTRKTLTARRELALRRASALDGAEESIKQDVANTFDGHLKILETRRSPDGERLDHYVREAIRAATPPYRIEALERYPEAPSCASCTGADDLACCGVDDDTNYLRAQGSCVRPLKEACDLAVAVMRHAYAATSFQTPSTANVRFYFRSDCKPNVSAPYCIEGRSRFADTAGWRWTEVDITIGLAHWSLDSYRALTITLLHELICHAGHGLANEALRAGTAPQDWFAEGWMDYVAAESVFAFVDDPTIVAPLREVSMTLRRWRLAERWDEPCGFKNTDRTSDARKRGAERAAAAHKLFTNRASRNDFLLFSTAFNARIVEPTEREALLRDVTAVSGLHTKVADHPFLEAIAGYAKHHDIDKFVGAWRKGMVGDV